MRREFPLKYREFANSSYDGNSDRSARELFVQQPREQPEHYPLSMTGVSLNKKRLPLGRRIPASKISQK